MSYPDDNPKTAVGATKVPLHLVPPVASHYMALAFKDGAAKYGPYNWREHRVSASVYYGAARRHLDAWWDGENVSQDALVHHLGHVMACCAILLDAMAVDKLNDDRPLAGATARLQAEAAGAPLARGARVGVEESPCYFCGRFGCHQHGPAPVESAYLDSFGPNPVRQDTGD